MSNNSDVLNFLEDVQNIVNIYNVRNALEAVSNAVSDLTKNFHLKASIFTDVSLSVTYFIVNTKVINYFHKHSF